ncbi:MAG: lysophospholipid acyltransferase family protein [Bacteroidota bacterium]|nr:lysophospholipid acyltransferase family protein [Bacteroidota bacterium]
MKRWSLGYAALKCYITLVHRIYYKKVFVQGKENIPANEPVIFAPNHQNALMDALAVISTVNKQPVFLARADMFKKKTTAKFLHFLKILPVYRMRDGIENMNRNEKIFRLSSEILNNNQAMGIMPEGNHGDKKQLRPLKKGLLHIAFQAQQKYGDQPGVKIIPVGLDYSNYQKFRSTLFINYGKPIEISTYWQEYQKDGKEALHDLKKELGRELKDLMINIESKEYYSAILHSIIIYREKMAQKMKLNPKNPADLFKASKEIEKALNICCLEHKPELDELNGKLGTYSRCLEILNLRDWVMKENVNLNHFNITLSFTLLILSYPIFIYGIICNYLPFHIPVSIAKRIKDMQFISSVQYGSSLITFPLYYLFLIGLLSSICGNILIILFFALSLPLSGLFSFYYFCQYKKLLARLKVMILSSKGNRSIRKLIDLRKEIITILDTLTGHTA